MTPGAKLAAIIQLLLSAPDRSDASLRLNKRLIGVAKTLDAVGARFLIDPHEAQKHAHLRQMFAHGPDRIVPLQRGTP